MSYGSGGHSNHVRRPSRGKSPSGIAGGRGDFISEHLQREDIRADEDILRTRRVMLMEPEINAVNGNALNATGKGKQLAAVTEIDCYVEHVFDLHIFDNGTFMFHGFNNRNKYVTCQHKM